MHNGSFSRDGSPFVQKDLPGLDSTPGPCVEDELDRNTEKNFDASLSLSQTSLLRQVDFAGALFVVQSWDKRSADVAQAVSLCFAVSHASKDTG